MNISYTSIILTILDHIPDTMRANFLDRACPDAVNTTLGPAFISTNLFVYIIIACSMAITGYFGLSIVYKIIQRVVLAHVIRFPKIHKFSATYVSKMIFVSKTLMYVAVGNLMYITVVFLQFPDINVDMGKICDKTLATKSANVPYLGDYSIFGNSYYLYCIVYGILLLGFLVFVYVILPPKITDTKLQFCILSFVFIVCYTGFGVVAFIYAPGDSSIEEIYAILTSKYVYAYSILTWSLVILFISCIVLFGSQKVNSTKVHKNIVKQENFVRYFTITKYICTVIAVASVVVVMGTTFYLHFNYLPMNTVITYSLLKVGK